MRIYCVALGLLLVLCSCDLGYGPVRDQSQFVSAQLAEDKRSVLFSYHRFRYRSATGWRAFPDGGIPKYLTDVNLLGVYDLPSGKVTILHRERNTKWQPGSGLSTIQALKGEKALVAQGGQLRGDFALGLKHLLIDFERGTTTELDLKGDLAARGRDLGQIYLVDGEGTLLFITLSLEEVADSKARRDRSSIPEIWVRTTDASYFKVAKTAHYECTRSGEVIYWEPSTREFYAFSIAQRTLRNLPGYKVSGFEDVSEGVALSSDRKGLEFGTKTNGQWRYRPLKLTQGQLE